MTITYGRHGRVVEFTLDDTVGFVLPPASAPTQAINVTRLRADLTDVERTSFAVLSPSGEQPLIGINPDQTAVIDALQERFNRFGVDEVAPNAGRHRAARPGMFARLLTLFARGRRDGA